LPAEDEHILTNDIVELASRFGRYGYRRITALLRHRGWSVNHKRVERIWRREGLKVPGKQRRRARLWLNDGSSIRLRPERPNHVWAYDFVLVRTHDGRAVRLLTVIDEYTRECLAIRADRHIRSCDVIETLTEAMVVRGVPDTSAPTTARSLRPRLFGSGLERLELRHCTSSPVHRGRTATWRASTESSGTSYWIERSSTHCRRCRY